MAPRNACPCGGYNLCGPPALLHRREVEPPCSPSSPYETCWRLLRVHGAGGAAGAVALPVSMLPECLGAALFIAARPRTCASQIQRYRVRSLRDRTVGSCLCAQSATSNPLRGHPRGSPSRLPTLRAPPAAGTRALHSGSCTCPRPSFPPGRPSQTPPSRPLSTPS